MNWGTRIVIFYSLFVAGILFLVIKSTFHTWDLVAEDYYGDEIKYESRINAMNNTGKLSNKPSMFVDGKIVRLNFPSELMSTMPAGKLKFYKPADKSGDFELPIQLDTNGLQSITVPQGKTGIYHAQLSWSAMDKQYYQEYNLLLP